jgi:hypothetical protein
LSIFIANGIKVKEDNKHLKILIPPFNISIQNKGLTINARFGVAEKYFKMELCTLDTYGNNYLG